MSMSVGNSSLLRKVRTPFLHLHAAKIGNFIFSTEVNVYYKMMKLPNLCSREMILESLYKELRHESVPISDWFPMEAKSAPSDC